MKRIVVGVDVSEASLRAVDFAADLAGKYDAELVLLTVGHEVVGQNRGLEEYARLEHIEEPISAIEWAREGLAQVRDRAIARGARQIRTEVLIGDPAEQILAHAASRQADLIVVGNRGHGKLMGLLLGSIAQKIVARSTCAVLVVR